MPFPLDESLIEERFIRSSGPGGQNVNKVATAVELRFDVGRSALPDQVKARLRVLAGKRMTSDDVLVVDAREHRTQPQNREAARARLEALVGQAFVRPRARRKTKPTAKSRADRLQRKAHRSAVKESRRRKPSEE